MKKIKTLILIMGIVSSVSCSKNVVVNYQVKTENTGTVVLRASKPTERTTVSIDGYFLVSKRKIKSVTIRNIPDGSYKIRYAAGNNWHYKGKVDMQIPVAVENGKTITEFIKIPPYSTGYWLSIAGQVLISAVISVAVK